MAESIRVFVSYRRADTGHVAGRLGDLLQERFGHVFMDVDTIEPGVDFREAIRHAVSECDVLLAVIGTQWINAVDEHGKRRLDDPQDWMVEEIRVALQRDDVRVIPVLVDGTPMPKSNALPLVLSQLASRQALTLRLESFRSDAARLVAAIERMLAPTPPAPTPTARPRPDVTDAAPSVGVDVGTAGGLYGDHGYSAALAAFFSERWEEAIGLLTEVLERHPKHPQVTDRLDQARAQQQLLDLDARAAQSETDGDWELAVESLEQISLVQPGYRNAAARLEVARTQREVADLQADLRALNAAGHWAAVIAAGKKLSKLDPESTDPDGLVTAARARLADAALADRYANGLRQLDQGAWAEAAATFSELQAERADYRDAAALRARALKQAGPPALRSTPTFVPEPQTLQVGFPVRALAFGPAGTWLATGGGDGGVRIWDTRTGQQQLRVSHLNGVIAVAFSPDGSRLAVAGFDPPEFSARIWDATTGQQQLQITHNGEWIWAVAFSPDGSRLASGSHDCTATVWDARTGHQQLKITHPHWVTGVAFSPDGTRLATSCGDNSARIWDANTGQQQFHVTHAGQMVWGVAFSPDGTQVASASDDRTARIWDVVTGEQQFQVQHSRSVSSVAFSPDGTRLATASHMTGCIWDITTRRLKLEAMHTGWVPSVAFSPDGTRLATGSSDSTARIWDATVR